MEASAQRPCILLPCSAASAWALPQGCLGEIVTVATTDQRPPQELLWRGEEIPVVDFGPDDDAPWRDARTGSGLVAVILGSEGETCRYWGVAVRGAGLAVADLGATTVEDLPDAVQEYSCAAFRLQDRIYQVPDLLRMQRAIGDKVMTGGDVGPVRRLEQ